MHKLRAIVTGASSGIGRATVEALIEANIEVVAASRSWEKLRDLRDKCAIHPCDVTNQWNCEHLIDFAKTGNPRTPVLINAAGTAHFGPFAEIEDVDEAEQEEDIDRQLREHREKLAKYVGQISANLLGPMHLCKAAIPWMLESGGGHILNVLSIAATHPFPGAAAYCASKAGLHMFGKALAAEYRSQNIRVTSLILGSTDTPLWDNQSFQPNRAEMLTPKAVAECIRDVVLSPPDRSYDEITLMPPKGIL
jgi:NAD(P)-dependent dehydrogenase (short-subunit alcohol dehydrogenase family)